MRYTVRTWINTGLDGWQSGFQSFNERSEAEAYALWFINESCQGEVIARDAWIFDNVRSEFLPGWGDEEDGEEVLYR